ncbi:putative S-adenosyl-L-methionine-dependent methyltransferase [Dillenia turbinata]|uniref:Methyltransferase n=1 Tax=Dillenia turbinata TaxID=194707 RepID=A0AAN8W109_9MAGN
MALAKLGRQAKRRHGFCVKMTAVAILGLCFIFVWSMFSSPVSSVTSQRSSFGDIAVPTSAAEKFSSSYVEPKPKIKPEKHESSKEEKKVELESGSEKKRVDRNASSSGVSEHKSPEKKEMQNQDGKGKLPDGIAADGQEGSEDNVESEKENGGGEEDEEAIIDDDGAVLDSEGEGSEVIEKDGERTQLVDQENVDKMDDGNEGFKGKGKKKKILGPLFDPKARYNWKLCAVRTKHNYIPCIDIEGGTGRMQSYRHHERSCPRTPPMCLVTLPADGYVSSISWPDSRYKILYKNVAHPKLAAFIRSQGWVVESGDYLTFPQNQSEFRGGVQHYLEFIEEMVPDIEWGKNVRVVLDLGCRDASFGNSLIDKEVLTLSLGLKDDLADLAQVVLERGFPSVVSPFATRRLPFPSGVFDAIHCGGCLIAWHTNEGKLLLEMNRILRPGGYFIISMNHNNAEHEEGMTSLMASICWNILAHKTDEDSEVDVRIYQKPDSNDIYELRRKKFPPMCKENENADATWYVPINMCLHTIPSSIEERGAEWPEQWPNRLDTFPDWMNEKERLLADTEHWKAIVDKSYLTGFGIDWSKIRNVMDMKAIYGGCKQPVAIIVEMDRILRPGGFVILRDKVVILDPIEEILRSMHWEIRMTYHQDKEGVFCAQKSLWRP